MSEVATESDKVVKTFETFEEWLEPLLREMYIWKYPLQKVVLWKEAEISHKGFAYEVFCVKWVDWLNEKKKDKCCLKKQLCLCEEVIREG